jgi:uncharacterized protein (TIGR02996 family)
LLQAILEQPEDLFLALILADWCDENGHEEEAAFLRMADPPTDAEEHEAYRQRLWKYRGTLPRNNLIVCSRARVTPYNGVMLVGQGELGVSYGFVRAVAAPWHVFTDIAADLFTRNPIARVTLLHLSPERTIPRLDSIQHLWWSSWHFGPHGLPRELRPFLAGYQHKCESERPIYPTTHYCYASNEEAFQALSDAAVRWGIEQRRCPREFISSSRSKDWNGNRIRIPANHRSLGEQ